MALFGLAAANNLADVTDRERAWDNIGAVVDSGGVPDPDYPNVSLLLHGDGTNGSTSIIDSSPSPKTVTAVGNAQISTAQSKFGGSSIAFDGTGDYLSVPNDGTLQMGSVDFTIEFWIYFNSLSGYQTPFDKGVVSAGALLMQTGNGDGRINVYASGSLVFAESTNGSTATWTHYALVRNSGTLKLYRDGTETGSVANSTNFNSAETVGIGAYASFSPGAYSVNGYIDDLRITKVARYTANFTPPTAPFYDSSNNSLVNLTLAVTGRDILALEAVRNVSTRDFVFIKSLSSPAQPRLTSAAASAASAASLRDNALLRASPVSTGDYTISGFFLDAASLRINNVSVASIATTPFSGSTATTSLLISSFLAPANFRFTQAMTSGTVLTGDRAIPIEGNDLILYAKAGQN
jgi:hypothetical protein